MSAATSVTLCPTRASSYSEGDDGIPRAIPTTRAPTACSHSDSHAPLNPVWPVRSTVRSRQNLGFTCAIYVLGADCPGRLREHVDVGVEGLVALEAEARGIERPPSAIVDEKEGVLTERAQQFGQLRQRPAGHAGGALFE